MLLPIMKRLISIQFGDFMAKQSALYKLYADRLSRCKSPDELLQLSREISNIPFKAHERTALMLSCVFIAKQFDRDAKKLRKVIANEDFSVDCDDQK